MIVLYINYCSYKMIVFRNDIVMQGLSPPKEKGLYREVQIECDMMNMQMILEGQKGKAAIHLFLLYIIYLTDKEQTKTRNE